jgi:hypothetical protein
VRTSGLRVSVGSEGRESLFVHKDEIVVQGVIAHRPPVPAGCVIMPGLSMYQHGPAGVSHSL